MHFGIALDVYPTSEAGVRSGRQCWGKAEVWAEQGRREETEQIRELDRGQKNKGVRKAKGIEEDGVSGLFPHQIIDSLPHFLY